jgi:hypothetical protein
VKWQLKNVSPIATQQYIEKADHFLQGMKLLVDDIPAYRTGIGLLAIHSAVSLGDAITIGITGRRGKYQDHDRAARELGKICASHGVSNTKGIDHLSWLLGWKNAVAYEHHRIDNQAVLMAVDKAERFNAWAYNYFREILRVAQGGT